MADYGKEAGKILSDAMTDMFKDIMSGVDTEVKKSNSAADAAKKQANDLKKAGKNLEDGARAYKQSAEKAARDVSSGNKAVQKANDGMKTINLGGGNTITIKENKANKREIEKAQKKVNSNINSIYSHLDSLKDDMNIKDLVRGLKDVNTEISAISKNLANAAKINGDLKESDLKEYKKQIKGLSKESSKFNDLLIQREKLLNAKSVFSDSYDNSVKNNNNFKNASDVEKQITNLNRLAITEKKILEVDSQIKNITKGKFEIYLPEVKVIGDVDRINKKYNNLTEQLISRTRTVQTNEYVKPIEDAIKQREKDIANLAKSGATISEIMELNNKPLDKSLTSAYKNSTNAVKEYGLEIEDVTDAMKNLIEQENILESMVNRKANGASRFSKENIVKALVARQVLSKSGKLEEFSTGNGKIFNKDEWKDFNTYLDGVIEKNETLKDIVAQIEGTKIITSPVVAVDTQEQANGLEQLKEKMEEVGTTAEEVVEKIEHMNDAVNEKPVSSGGSTGGAILDKAKALEILLDKYNVCGSSVEEVYEDIDACINRLTKSSERFSNSLSKTIEEFEDTIGKTDVDDILNNMKYSLEGLVEELDILPIKEDAIFELMELARTRYNDWSYESNVNKSDYEGADDDGLLQFKAQAKYAHNAALLLMKDFEDLSDFEEYNPLMGLDWQDNEKNMTRFLKDGEHQIEYFTEEFLSEQSKIQASIDETKGKIEELTNLRGLVDESWFKSENSSPIPVEEKVEEQVKSYKSLINQLKLVYHESQEAYDKFHKFDETGTMTDLSADTYKDNVIEVINSSKYLEAELSSTYKNAETAVKNFFKAIGDQFKEFKGWDADIVLEAMKDNSLWRDGDFNFSDMNTDKLGNSYWQGGWRINVDGNADNNWYVSLKVVKDEYAEIIAEQNEVAANIRSINNYGKGLDKIDYIVANMSVLQSTYKDDIHYTEALTEANKRLTDQIYKVAEAQNYAVSDQQKSNIENMLKNGFEWESTTNHLGEDVMRITYDSVVSTSKEIMSELEKPILTFRQKLTTILGSDKLEKDFLDNMAENVKRGTLSIEEALDKCKNKLSSLPQTNNNVAISFDELFESVKKVWKELNKYKIEVDRQQYSHHMSKEDAEKEIKRWGMNLESYQRIRTELISKVGEESIVNDIIPKELTTEFENASTMASKLAEKLGIVKETLSVKAEPLIDVNEIEVEQTKVEKLVSDIETLIRAKDKLIAYGIPENEASAEDGALEFGSLDTLKSILSTIKEINNAKTGLKFDTNNYTFKEFESEVTRILGMVHELISIKNFNLESSLEEQFEKLTNTFLKNQTAFKEFNKVFNELQISLKNGETLKLDDILWENGYSNLNSSRKALQKIKDDIVSISASSRTFDASDVNGNNYYDYYDDYLYQYSRQLETLMPVIDKITEHVQLKITELANINPRFKFLDEDFIYSNMEDAFSNSFDKAKEVLLSHFSSLGVDLEKVFDQFDYSNTGWDMSNRGFYRVVNDYTLGSITLQQAAEKIADAYGIIYNVVDSNSIQEQNNSALEEETRLFNELGDELTRLTDKYNSFDKEAENAKDYISELNEEINTLKQNLANSKFELLDARQVQKVEIILNSLGDTVTDIKTKLETSVSSYSKEDMVSATNIIANYYKSIGKSIGDANKEAIRFKEYIEKYKGFSIGSLNGDLSINQIEAYTLACEKLGITLQRITKKNGLIEYGIFNDLDMDRIISIENARDFIDSPETKITTALSDWLKNIKNNDYEWSEAGKLIGETFGEAMKETFYKVTSDMPDEEINKWSASAIYEQIVKQFNGEHNQLFNPEIRFNTESTGQLAMQIEGVTEASWGLIEAEKEVEKELPNWIPGQISNIEKLNDTLLSTDERVRAINKRISDAKEIIGIQNQWINFTKLLEPGFFESENKQTAVDQLRNWTNRLVNYRSGSYKNTNEENKINVGWYKAMEEAKKKGVSDKWINQYDTDINERIYTESLNRLVEAREFAIKTIEEQNQRLIELNSDLELAKNPPLSFYNDQAQNTLMLIDELTDEMQDMSKISVMSDEEMAKGIEEVNRVLSETVKLDTTASLIEDQIKDFATGNQRYGEAISSDDPLALDKLKAKLSYEQRIHQEMVEVNKEARKLGKEAPYAPYQLSNSNGRIKQIQDRIADVFKQLARGTEDIITEYSNGVQYIKNSKENRLQFKFDGKPDDNTRQVLKGNGFKWSPSQEAWQRQWTDNAEYSVKRIVEALKLEEIQAEKTAEAEDNLNKTRNLKAAPRENVPRLKVDETQNPINLPLVETEQELEKLDSELQSTTRSAEELKSVLDSFENSGYQIGQLRSVYTAVNKNLNENSKQYLEWSVGGLENSNGSWWAENVSKLNIIGYYEKLQSEGKKIKQEIVDLYNEIKPEEEKLRSELQSLLDLQTELDPSAMQKVYEIDGWPNVNNYSESLKSVLDRVVELAGVSFTGKSKDEMAELIIEVYKLDSALQEAFNNGELRVDHLNSYMTILQDSINYMTKNSNYMSLLDAKDYIANKNDVEEIIKEEETLTAAQKRRLELKEEENKLSKESVALAKEMLKQAGFNVNDEILTSNAMASYYDKNNNVDGMIDIMVDRVFNSRNISYLEDFAHNSYTILTNLQSISKIKYNEEDVKSFGDAWEFVKKVVGKSNLSMTEGLGFDVIAQGMDQYIQNEIFKTTNDPVSGISRILTEELDLTNGMSKIKGQIKDNFINNGIGQIGKESEVQSKIVINSFDEISGAIEKSSLSLEEMKSIMDQIVGLGGGENELLDFLNTLRSYANSQNDAWCEDIVNYFNELANNLQKDVKLIEEVNKFEGLKVYNGSDGRDIISQSGYKKTSIITDDEGTEHEVGKFSFIERLRDGEIQRVLVEYDELTQEWYEQVIGVSIAFEKVGNEIIALDTKISNAKSKIQVDELKLGKNYDSSSAKAALKVDEDRVKVLEDTLKFFEDEEEYEYERQKFDERRQQNQTKINALLDDSVKKEKARQQNASDKKVIQDQENYKKAVDKTNESLRQQEERIKNINGKKINNPKNNISNIDDITSLAYAENEIRNKISSLKNTDATTAQIGEVKNLVNEYERLADSIVNANQLSQKQLTGEDNVVRIEQLITKISVLIDKTKEYSGTSSEINKITQSLEAEKESLRETSEILQGLKTDSQGNVINISSKDVQDKYYSSQSNYKKNSALIEQLKLEQDNIQETKDKYTDYIDSIYKKQTELNNLKADSIRNPDKDFSNSYNQLNNELEELKNNARNSLDELKKLRDEGKISESVFRDLAKQYSDTFNRSTTNINGVSIDSGYAYSKGNSQDKIQQAKTSAAVSTIAANEKASAQVEANRIKAEKEEYNDLISTIKELTKARKDLQTLESNARKNPTLDYTQEIEDQKAYIRGLESIVNNNDNLKIMSKFDLDSKEFKDYTDAVNNASKAEKDLNNQRQLFSEADQKSALDEYKKSLEELAKTYKNFANDSKGKRTVTLQEDAQQVANAEQRMQEMRQAAIDAGVSISELDKITSDSFRDISASIGNIGSKTIDDYINKVEALSEKMQKDGTATGDTLIKLERLKQALYEIQQSSDLTTNEGIGEYLLKINQAGATLPSTLKEIEDLGKVAAELLNIKGNIKIFEGMDNQTVKAKSLLSELKDKYESLEQSIKNSGGKFVSKDQIDQLNKINSLIAQMNKQAYGKGNLVPETKGNVSKINDLSKAMKNYAEDLGYTKQIGKEVANADGTLRMSFKNSEGQVLDLTASYNQLYKGMNVVSQKATEQKGIWGKLSGTIGGLFKQFTYFFSGYHLAMKFWSSMREGFNTVKELDSALTEMRKVSNETLESLKEFQDVSFSIGQGIGKTAYEIQQSAADFMRLGNL